MCNDGVTIAKEFEWENHEKYLGVLVLRQAAQRTGELEGDDDVDAARDGDLRRRREEHRGRRQRDR